MFLHLLKTNPLELSLNGIKMLTGEKEESAKRVFHQW